MRGYPSVLARNHPLPALALVLLLSLPSGAAWVGPHSPAVRGPAAPFLPRGAFLNRNVSFSGNLGLDFGGGPLYQNTNASAWGAGNALLGLYAAYNRSDLFLGIQENITGNSLMVFVGGEGVGGMGTFNLSGLNAWSRSITFTSPVSDIAALYFGGNNINVSGYGVYQVLTPPSDSNSTPSDRMVSSTHLFSAVNGSVEIALPIASVFPSNPSPQENLTLGAFVVGSSGSWVGTGIPFPQAGKYNAGGTQTSFLVNDTLRLPLAGLPVSPSQPINVAIVFNDHQPVYEVAGQATYNLPWTEAHATAEYIEQPLLLRQYPGINITYELSGSLLWQLENISTDPGFNDSFIQGAFLPYSQLNTTQNQTLLSNLTSDYFSVPGYVYDFNETASRTYRQLETQWSSGKPLNASQFEDAKVLWFLYEVSTDLVEGRLGSSWISPSLWALHNQSSFTQSDLKTILQYSQWLTGQVIPAFRSVMLGNQTGSDNTELFTSPFYHPLTPLLLTPSISGPSGSLTKGVYTSDVLAQMNLSRDQFDQIFGQYPRGLYASEAAVSEAMVPLVAMSGAQWTATDEWTLQQSGVPASAWGDPSHTVASLEDLYTPYVVQDANGTSTIMLFRDAPLSNAWAFNYGNQNTTTSVSDIVNYLKAINGAIPVGDHPRTLVTLMLDGENWQFMSPFADDGIPFLEALYRALEQNRSYLHTVTPSQFLDSLRGQPWLLPSLGAVATGTWNQGSGSSAPDQSNPSLTQWSGYPAQDWMWQDLDTVRQQVVQFQQRWGLTQLENLTAFDRNLTASTLEGNLTRAWYGIYNAEGSDWYFQMAPWTISGANTAPFNATFQGDLAYALSQLHPILTPPSITAFTASPNPVPVNGTSRLDVSVSGGVAPVSFQYAGLPPGCHSADSSVLNCTPTSAGNFTLRVYANDSLGHSANDSLLLSVTPRNSLVSVAITPSQASIFPLRSENLTATALCSGAPTPCPSGLTYTWSTSNALGTVIPFANGTARFVAGNLSGNTSVTVTARLNGTNRTSAPAFLTVLPLAPPISVKASASVLSGTTPLPVNFTSSISGGTAPFSTVWTFGDGKSSLVPDPAHTYVRGGRYIVNLWVNDSSLPSPQRYHATLEINVTGLSVTLSPIAEIALGGTIQITAVVSGAVGAVTYQWTTLPPGCTGGNLSQISCIPSRVGSFPIQLNVTDSAGQTASGNTSAAVRPPPSCGCVGPAAPSPVIWAALGVAAVAFLIGVYVLRSRSRHRGGSPKNDAPASRTPEESVSKKAPEPEPPGPSRS